MRECSHCHKPLLPQELVREVSKGMESERNALGLEGVRFLYYTCSGCGYADIFVDVHPIAGESANGDGNWSQRFDNYTPNAWQ
jgi:hypothetical protein